MLKRLSVATLSIVFLGFILFPVVAYAQEANYYCNPNDPFIVRLGSAIVQVGGYMLGVALSVGATWAALKAFFSGPSFESGSDVIENLVQIGEAFGILAVGVAAAGYCLAGASHAMSCGGASSNSSPPASYSPSPTIPQAPLDSESLRAAKAFRSTWLKEGVEGLRQNVRECYPRAGELKTEMSALFCFVFDYLTASKAETFGTSQDRLAGVNHRINDLLDFTQMIREKRQETIAKWMEAAERAYASLTGKRQSIPETSVPAAPPLEPNDPTFCLNQISRAKARYESNWIQAIQPDIVRQCQREIRQEQSREGASTTPSQADDVLSNLLRTGRAQWTITSGDSLLSPLTATVTRRGDRLTFVIQGLLPDRDGSGARHSAATSVKIYVYEHAGANDVRLERFDQTLGGFWAAGQPFTVQFDTPPEIIDNARGRTLTMCIGNEGGCFPSSNLLPPAN